MSSYHSSRSGLNLARSFTPTVRSRMTHLGNSAILIWRLTTAFSSPIQKLVWRPTTLRMSGGMLSKPNLHMVQSMPMCCHTWPIIYGGGSFQTRTTSSCFCGTDFLSQHLECTMAAVTSWTSPHLLALVRATKSSRKNCTSKLWYQKPKGFFKVTLKNQKILICPLLIHCQRAYNSKFIIDSPRFSILINMLLKMGVSGHIPNHNCAPPPSIHCKS